MAGSNAVTSQPSWLLDLARSAQARLALGQAGTAQPITAQLRFGLDHARARDAVHTALDTSNLEAGIARFGLAGHIVQSNASDRASFLLRPDMGRQLCEASKNRLVQDKPTNGIVVAIGDGLSAQAANENALPVLSTLIPLLPASLPLTVVLARQCRVALGDAIAMALGARMVLVLLGERPGLSSSRSLGAYLTLAPSPATSDADRNCVSNIRPEGLPPEEAARKLGWLVSAALRQGETGVRLEDKSGSLHLPNVTKGPGDV